MDDNNFDKKVAEYLNHRKMEVSPDAWQKLTTELSLQPKSNPKYWIASAAAVLVLGLVWVLKQDAEKVPITVVEPSKEINLNPVHSVLSGEVKQVERKNSTKTSYSELPTVVHSKKKVSSDLIKPIAIAENIPVLTEYKKVDLVMGEETKSPETYAIKVENSDELAIIDVVLKNLELPESQFTIDPDELLKMAETEIKKEKDKRFRTKVIEKAKKAINDLNIAIK